MKPPNNPYATGTKTSVPNSIAEIQRTLQRWGCTHDMVAEGSEGVLIAFKVDERLVRFQVPYGDADQPEKRRLWRSLAMCIKAKLETATSGISSIEQEFMAHMVLPDNSLVADRVIPMIETAYQTGRMPETSLTMLLEGPKESIG